MPGFANIFIIAAGATVALIATPAVITTTGFTSAGVAAGSVAAAVQSALYGGATTGVFSTLQSVGVVGMGAAAKVITGVVGAAAAAAAFV